MEATKLVLEIMSLSLYESMKNFYGRNISHRKKNIKTFGCNTHQLTLTNIPCHPKGALSGKSYLFNIDCSLLLF